MTVAVAELAGFLVGVLVTAGWFGMAQPWFALRSPAVRSYRLAAVMTLLLFRWNIDRIAAASVGVTSSGK